MTDQISFPPTQWHGRALRWGEQTLVMGIVNATPDSFSGDGIGDDAMAASDVAERAVAAGAHLIDIGAESTRPGHAPIDAAEEERRLLPILTAISPHVSVPISVDTSKARVAEAALAGGASIVNDIRGLTADPELGAVVARHGVPLILMHDIPPDPYGDLLSSIVRELSRRLDRALAAGVGWEMLIVDPGFGFGKDWRQNLELLRRLGELQALGRPILIGFSRKSTIGRVLGLPPAERLEGTLATTALAITGGADIVRVHDVEPNVRVTRMVDAVVRRAPGTELTWTEPGGG
ncbi:MAG TPA: dihydropteroate synthase [Thermomicrobiales bacterium]|nr:dihydropteroate synthase [Thermomicrobiales bacterium]